jgi:hypothetical protein
MNDKLLLSFTVATFVAALGVMWFLAGVRGRLDHVEQEVAAVRTATERPPAAPLTGGGKKGQGEVNPLETKDPVVKLDWLIEKLEEVDDNAYEYYNDTAQELYQTKRDLTRLRAVVLRILQGLRTSGDFPGMAPDLPEPQEPISAETAEKYRAEAERYGIRVEPGRVTARGLLNASQDKAYPIEYFMTRFPDAGHETLVHLIGSARVEDFSEPPFPDLGGLCTALYKALLAAGFSEGEPSHPDPESPDPQTPRWVLASGDKVYLYVRYEEDGQENLARATDWVIDPTTGAPLPEDSFRFTGSTRVEDPNTGEPILLAEPRGFLVSVFPDHAALIEVALETALKNNYQYNWSRLPKHPGNGPFYVDLIFSKTPLKK